jgi:hypothetical protein
MMSDVKWTKTYRLAVDGRHFRVFLSEQEDQGFHVSCLWYERGRLLKAPGQPGALQFQLEQRHSSSESAALSDLLAWVNSRFKNVGELEADPG